MQVLTTVDDAAVAHCRDVHEFFWLDLVSPSDDELRRLGEALGLHPLALEDTMEFGQRPKLDPYDDHVLLVAYGAQLTSDEPRAEPVEVHVYVHGQFVLTIRRGSCAQLAALHEVLAAHSTEVEDYLVYRVLEALGDSFAPVLEAIDARVDELEDGVLTSPRNDQLQAIYWLRQDTRALLRRALPQREAFDAAIDQILAVPGLSRGPRAYLRDAGDQFAEAAGNLERINADLQSLTDSYYAANSNKLNKLATGLSLVASIFLVATLVTSFFGQNFDWLVANVDTKADFLIFGVGGLVVPTALLCGVFWVRRHDLF